MSPARPHDQWSASATPRNVHCAGALAMATIAPPQPESEAAAWGTACHEIAERCLRGSGDTIDFLDDEIGTKTHQFTVDEEMARTAQRHVDYCRSRIDDYKKATGGDAIMWVEHKFSFAKLDPPFEAGGTGDCVMCFPLWKTIEIVDLKGGRGVVVEAAGNMQARSYALGALLEFGDLEVDIVRSTIIQPRASHPDGPIRSEEIHVADLIDWTHELLRAMRRSREAMTEFEALGGNSVKFEEWAERWLKTGACQFCPAAGFCPALKSQAHATAGVWFDDLDRQVIGNALPIESAAALGRTLDGLEALEEWVKAVRAHAHGRAERGEAIPGWMLVDKIGHRAWIAGKTDAALAEKLNLNEDALWVQKLKSPAQVEKLVKQADFAALEGLFWEKPVKGANLVSVDKTERTPAKSKPELLFEEIR